MSRLDSKLAATLGISLLICVLFGSGANVAGQPAELPTAEDVLQRFVSAVGGRAALERIQARHFRGTIIQDLTWKENYTSAEISEAVYKAQETPPYVPHTKPRKQLPLKY